MLDQKRVILGMSGGVDSSVAAVILQKQGYEVIAVFMKNWSEDDGSCTAREDYRDVMRVCSQLGIQYYTVNFEQEYRDQVFSYFLSEYEKGRTPNPDVMCNTEIKFKAFLDYAMSFEADFIAMGHYARTISQKGKTYLLRGIDEQKDQSYFLSRVPEKSLEKCLFPLGDWTKEEVRRMARQYELPTATKKDSTGICFIGERDFNAFLDQFLLATPGPIRDMEGNLLGEHTGLIHYTIGQRRGMGIGGRGSGDPFFVADKDLSSNTLFVAQGVHHPALYRRQFLGEEPFWITEEPSFPLNCSVKIRYRAPDVAAIVTKEEDHLLIVLDQALKGVTPGQVVVFYKEAFCLGSAIIK